MADELSRAISFANGYFVLADGLVPNLEEHLAEDVVLDWFGQTIEGRDNVATFMKYQKISSRHIFNEVNPVTTIGYQKQRPLRRKYYSIGGTHENGNLFSIRNKKIDYVEDGDDNDDDENYQIKYKRQCFSDGIIIENLNQITDESSDNINDMRMDCDDESEYKKISLKLHENKKIKNENISNISMEYNLNFDKLKLDADNFSTPKAALIKQRDFLDSDDVNCALNVLGDEIKLKPELKATDIMEIEKKIIQLKDKKPAEFIKIELGQGDGPSIYNETNSIKCIEACGAIEFSRYFNTKQIRKDIRKRLCRLQIAYSSKNNNKDVKNPINEPKRESTKLNSMEIDEKKIEIMSKKLNKLKSLKDLRELSNNLIPFKDDKIDFSPDDDDNVDDIANDRNKFLKCLKLNPMDNDDDNMNDLVTPKYVRHQLTFNKSPKRLLAGYGDTRGFVFNHIIHLIIYESNTKCRLNLSHEFENKELSDD